MDVKHFWKSDHKESDTGYFTEECFYLQEKLGPYCTREKFGSHLKDSIHARVVR